MDTTRRHLMAAAGGAGLAGASLASAATMPSAPPPAPVDQGSAAAGKVEFPPIVRETERPGSGPPNPDPPAERVGLAVMGLGRLAVENILPAIAQSKHVRLAGLVSGDPEKMQTLATQYGVDPASCYDYASFDRIRDNPAIQVVYIVLPNALHRDATVRAARAGKHVMCEKPMAANVAEAREMVAACKSAGRLLMIAYRIQYEVVNAELRRRARAGDLGQIQMIDSINTQNQGDPTQWRQRRALAGGGSLPDVGLYCLNTTRALLGEEPYEVSAAIHSPPADPRFREVESNVAFTLRFPSGIIAQCASSYSAHQMRNIRVIGDQAHAEIQNAFDYEGQRLRISRREGQAEGGTELALGAKNQFALEMDHFAQCVRTGARPRTPGEEGLQDHVVMAAIYEAARTGRPVALPRTEGRDVFRGPGPREED